MRPLRLLFIASLLSFAAACFHAHAGADWQILAGVMKTPWTDAVSPSNALPDYPRPQMVRTEWLNLNGLWDYAIAGSPSSRPSDFEGKILVPYPIESALSGVMRPLGETETLWYRRTFSVPSAWTGQRVLLRFGAVDWQATISVNGHELGRHRGGYDVFSFDITKALSSGGVQEIVVAVTDPTEGDQPRGKQSRKPEGIFYTACSGIWQTVWLEPVPEAGITELKMTPDLDRNALLLKVSTFANEEELQVEATAFEDDRPAGQITGPGNAELALPVKQPRLWTPQNPFLYTLRIVLKKQGQKIDEVTSYFGMRSTGLRRDDHGTMRIALNGSSYFAIGALDQGFWPDGICTPATETALQHDLRFLKSAGFDLVRKHVKVESERWYYWCDKLGLLVWQDMPSGNNNTPEGRIRFESELFRMVRQLHNHPSIVTWVLFNESWGQYDTERLTRLLKEQDASRLVDCASGWTDKRVGDLIDAHSYPFPEAPAPEVTRAAVVGEFGGLGLPVAGHQWSTDFWSYQTLPDEPALEGWYYGVLREIWSQKKSRGLSAAIYTQTTDVETECNGLLTYDRRYEKIPAERLVAMNRGELFERTMKPVLTNAVFGEPVWKYTFTKPPSPWTSVQFDDRQWLEGQGGFGTAFTRGSRVHTLWDSSDIWLRRAFVLGNEDLRNAKFHIHHDKGVEIYLNGVKALATREYLVDYALFDIAPEALATLQPGTNHIAVYCNQTVGGQFIDVGIVTLGRQAGTPPK